MSAPAGAEDAALHSLLTGDDTRGWEAVGRINLGESGFCTGALIAPDLVLTAAHCLYEKTSGQRYAPETIEFLAGWRNGRAAAYRGVKRALPHPDYAFEGSEDMGRVAYDLALLQLDQPIRLPSIRPFEVAADPRDGDMVGVVSYGKDRAEAPSLQESCEVLGRDGVMLVMSCSVDFGSSGAPVFAIEGGVAKIVSVVSAKAQVNEKPVSIGTPMQVPLAELRAALDAETMPVAVSGSSQPRILSGGISNGSAKFVRP